MTCSDLFPCRFVLFILWWHFYVGRAIVISLCRSHLGPGSVSFSKPQQLDCHIVSADSSNWWTLDEDCDDFCIFSLICKLSPRCVKAAVQVFAACALLFSVGFLPYPQDFHSTQTHTAGLLPVSPTQRDLNYSTTLFKLSFSIKVTHAQ